MTDERVAQAVEMRRQNLSVREIARMLRVHHTTIVRALKKYQPQGGVPGEPPPVQPLDTIMDKTDIDGSLDVLKHDGFMSPEDMMEALQLDPAIWIPQYFKGNTWEGFYKQRAVTRDDVVEMVCRIEEHTGVEIPPHKLTDAMGKILEECNAGKGHKKVKLFQSKLNCKRVVTEFEQAAILNFARKHVQPKPPPKKGRKKKPKDKREPFMVVWGLWDAHLGLYAWRPEVGADFDVDTAVTRILNSIDDIVQELRFYNIKKILMPVGNDFLHFDSVKMTTTMGEHFLDTDTRYARVFEAGLDCMEYMVFRALEICDDIELLYVPGNHDYTSAYTLTSCLRRSFKNDKRVKVDIGPNPHKLRLWGGILIGFDHGQIPASRWNTIFAMEAHKEWSRSSYREVQVGHTHQKREVHYEGCIPTNGLTIRTNPTMCNRDAWHHAKGFTGEPVKSVEAWRYDPFSYRGSHVAYVRDVKHPRTKEILATFDKTFRDLVLGVE